MSKRFGVGLLMVVGLLLVCGSYLTYGQDKNEVTVTGDVVCGHCTLKMVDQCTVALKADDGNYLLVKNDESDKIFDKRDKGVKAKVTGTVEEKDGKKWITATKVEVLESK